MDFLLLPPFILTAVASQTTRPPPKNQPPVLLAISSSSTVTSRATLLDTMKIDAKTSYVWFVHLIQVARFDNFSSTTKLDESKNWFIFYFKKYSKYENLQS
jgi:hypothetical protein